MDGNSIFNVRNHAKPYIIIFNNWIDEQLWGANLFASFTKYVC